MSQSDLQREKILVVDDSEINRSILLDILEEKFEIIEAADGVEALVMLEKYSTDISAVLLDIVMPRMNGFEVLAAMGKRGWIEQIPVLVISAENSATQIERAFGLGAIDFIMRPFDALLVYRRVVNTVLLYTKQKKLLDLVVDQINDKERRSNMMVDILSHIVEFRNGESSQHIVHVRTFTEVMLRQLQRMTSRYAITQADISLISTVSALHDIGKIAIDEKILHKPGRLTPEEFEEVKRHTVVGAQILEKLPAYRDARLLRTAWEICRWHHERWDGNGYPDGLAGDAIPISAQVVALADVYDALTRERCYKKAIPHKEAVQMILDGECGVFNPLLLDCLRAVEGTLDTEFTRVQIRESQALHSNLIDETLRGARSFASERSVRLMDQERMKNNLFFAMSNEIWFEYSAITNTLKLSEWGAKKLGLDEIIANPTENEDLKRIFGEITQQKIYKEYHAAQPSHDMMTDERLILVDGEPRWHRLVIQLLWSDDGEQQCLGLMGKAMDIHTFRTQLDELEKQATHDGMTGLMNRSCAKAQIIKRLESEPDANYAMIVFDLDFLKKFNDTYGHLAGSRVLKDLGARARQAVRDSDIVARIGGDEFLIFLQYKAEVDGAITRIFNALLGQYRDIAVTVSMGVAKNCDVGNEYDTLFHAADQALYVAKKSRNRCVFYDKSMHGSLQGCHVYTLEEEEDQ